VSVAVNQKPLQTTRFIMLRWLPIVGILLLAARTTNAAPPEHVVVFQDPKLFAGWPANVGLWHWDGGQEALVGFITGRYELRAGHNIKAPYTNRLARTSDGGRTWKLEAAKGFFQPGDKVVPFREPIPFDDANLALRFLAEGYHGGAAPPAVIFSRDRGKTWNGPFALPTLVPSTDKTGRTEVTLRTDYAIQGKDECTVFATARFPDKKGTDHAFACRLTEGGKKSIFLGWLAPTDSPNRAAMPATVRLGENRFVSAIRARKADADENWIEGYRSVDGGREWKGMGRIGSTGTGNGNPPALVRLTDGRLACVYGDRKRRKLYVRLSSDEGTNWGDETVLRDDYEPDAGGEKDFGYPRAFPRKDGALVVVYYWATKVRPTNHIAATIWTPPETRR
jgi:hypothetical protein